MSTLSVMNCSIQSSWISSPMFIGNLMFYGIETIAEEFDVSGIASGL